MNTGKAQQISEFLQGTCLSEFEAADAFGVDELDVLQAVSDVDDVERCSCCSWWCEKGDMVLEDGNEYVCSDCHEQSLDEESE